MMSEKDHKELSEILIKLIKEVAENRNEINEMKRFISHLVGVGKLWILIY